MSGQAPSILILDTTLRDGEQTQGVSFSPDEKTNIAKALLELVRVDRIEVASARVSSGELAAVTNIIDWARGQGLEGRVEVLGFVDHGRSVDWIRQAGGQRPQPPRQGERETLSWTARQDPGGARGGGAR